MWGQKWSPSKGKVLPAPGAWLLGGLRLKLSLREGGCVPAHPLTKMLFPVAEKFEVTLLRGAVVLVSTGSSPVV